MMMKRIGMLFMMLCLGFALLPGVGAKEAEAAPPNERFAALFYFTEFGDSFYSGSNTSPTGDSWIMQGQSPAYGPYGSINFWGKPLWAATHGDGTINNNYRFYFNGDPNQPNRDLLDWHADLITQAGVDFIVLDFTNGALDFPNGPSYMTATTALLNRWQERMNLGLPTPKVAFFVKDEATLTTVENQFLNVYRSDLFFNYLGKKMLFVAQPDSTLGINDPGQPAVPTNGKFANYTTRHMWGLDNSGAYWQFKVNSAAPPPPFYYNGQPEQMAVPVSTQATYMTTDGVNPSPGAIGRQNGSYFTTYMNAAINAGVKFVFIHSWNEWAAGNWGTQSQPNIVDQWMNEYSSDIEPMAGGHGWFYYNLMKQKIAEFKGWNVSGTGQQYRIVNKNSGKALTVSGGSTANSANIAQWTDTARQEQKWTLEATGDGYYKLRNANSGMLADVEASSSAPGANVSQYPDLNAANQQWQLVSSGDGYYRIKNRASGLMLEVAGASSADDGNVQQWTDNGCACQQWRIEPIGHVKLLNANSGKALDVVNAGIENGVNIQQWTDNGCLCQSWQFSALGNGYFRIVNGNSLKAVGIAGGIDANGSNILQWEPSGSPDQNWRLEFNGDGTVQLRSQLNNARNMDVEGFSTTNGANVSLYDANNTVNQRWLIVPAGA